MTFTFKGTDLRNIVQQDSQNNIQFGNFVGLTYLSSSNVSANSRPLTTGYQINGTDLADKAVAHISNIYKTSSLSVPTNAKAFRFIGVGGSGGGGGQGGLAIHESGADSYSPGGSGGAGGNGGWITSSDTNINNMSINVYVGAGGVQGNYGAPDTAPSSRSGAAQAGPGNTGGNGGPTYWTMGNTTSTAGVGGTGGSGGGGGRTNSGQSGIVDSGYSGTPGTPYNVVDKPSDWTYAPGTPIGGKMGQSGVSGSAQIIWLYN
jgi:hypothetical protein